MCPNFWPVLYIHIDQTLSKVIYFLFVAVVISHDTIMIILQYFFQ